MRKVKPYYVSGYKNMLFDGITTISIIQYLLPSLNYKMLPFMPVVLYLVLPLSFIYYTDFFSPRYILNFFMFSLPGIVSALWWIYCANNFQMGIIKLYKEERGKDSTKGFINLIVTLLAVFMSTIIWSCLLSFAVLMISALSIYIFNVLIETSPINSRYGIICYYVVTLPVVIGISYLTLVSLEIERRNRP